MRTYVTVDHNNATARERRAIRENQVREMNERPQNPITEVAVRNTIIPTAMDDPNSIRQSRIDCSSILFETICFRTLYWMEVDNYRGVSEGFYHEMRSYAQVPQGTDFNSDQLVPQGAMFDTGTADYHLSDEQYYRHRISELETRLRTLETDRIILPREEIEDIHAGVRQMGDRPIPSEYFEENLFEVS